MTYTKYLRVYFNMAEKPRASLLLLAVFSLLYSLEGKEDEFREELLIKPLPSGHIYAHFQFITRWDVEISDPKSCKCFEACFLCGETPASLSQRMRASGDRLRLRAV